MEDELDGFLNGDSEDTSHVQLGGEDDTHAQGDEHSGDGAAAEAEGAEGEGEQPKPKPKVQDRIDELTRARREAEREAAYWRGKAESHAKPEQRQERPQQDAEPDPADYQYGETDSGYIKALGAYTARQEFMRLSQESQRRNAVQTVEQSWEQRQADFAKEKPDYYDALNRDWPCTQDMAAAIKTSDEGAAVAYHLAQNPTEARRIAALNPLAQVREIGKLEAKLAAPAASSTPIKTVSTAPGPAPQARGLKGQFKAAPDTDDFAAFDKAYGG